MSDQWRLSEITGEVRARMMNYISQNTKDNITYPCHNLSLMSFSKVIGETSMMSTLDYWPLCDLNE